MAKDNTTVAVESVTITKEEMKELLKARETANKVKDTQRKQWVKQLLYARKAKEAGLTVTEKEIEDYINKVK